MAEQVFAQELDVILDSTDDAIVLLDLSGTVVSWNSGAERIYGYTEEEITGKNILVILPPGTLDNYLLLIAKVKQGEKIINLEAQRIRKDGKPIDVSITISGLKGENNEVIGTISIIRDISEKKLFERQILLYNRIQEIYWRASSKKEYLDQILAILHEWTGCEAVGIRIVDEKKMTVPYLAASGFSEEFLESESELSLKTDSCACTRAILNRSESQDYPVLTARGSFYIPNSRQFRDNLTPEQNIRYRGTCIRSGYQTMIVVPIRNKESTLGALHLVDKRANKLSLREVETLEIAAELVWQSISQFDNISEIKHSEKEIKTLTRRLVDTEESERQDIARELHDEIGQNLTGLKMMLSQIMRTGTEIQKPIIEDSQAIVSELIRQVREMALKLRPSMLDDLGLLPTLEWLFERYTSTTQIQVHFEQTGMDNKFRAEANTAVYRIIQEALTNVARYSGVKDVEISLKAEDGKIYIRVKDQGRGFDLSEAAKAASVGISGMRERAIVLGGKFNIQSEPGKGACITAEIPI
jgi:PAS domain S-box-containing protein